jgi:hypothetical protein
MFLFELLDDFFIDSFIFFFIVEGIVVFLDQNFVVFVFLNYEKVIFIVLIVFGIEFFQHIFCDALFDIFRGFELLDFVGN